MTPEPETQVREAQPYIAIPVRVTMARLADEVDKGFPELFGWLREHGITPSGAPFIRYLVIDMDGELDIELTAPVGSEVAAQVAGEVKGDGRVRYGVLPAGRYVTLKHVGPYDGLVASNARLQRWAEEHGIELQREDTDRGSVWQGRVEHYLTDPSAEPDPAKWETEVGYLVR
jgi:effector-binding domain-containing protein